MNRGRRSVLETMPRAAGEVVEAQMQAVAGDIPLAKVRKAKGLGALSVLRRRLIVFLDEQYPGFTLGDIGSLLGGLDHSTVLYHLGRAKGRVPGLKPRPRRVKVAKATPIPKISRKVLATIRKAPLPRNDVNNAILHNLVKRGLVAVEATQSGLYVAAIAKSRGSSLGHHEAA